VALKRLLYADDCKTSLALVDRFLSKFGYIVVAVSDGMQAVEQAKTSPFHAILMDMRMPVMDGVAATLAIRALPAPRCDTPIIGLTAGTDYEMRSCINCGMDLVLPKPINFEQLVEALSAITVGAAFAAVEPPPAAPATLRGSAPINLVTLQQVVDDLGRAAVRAAFVTFRQECADLLGGVALAAARRRASEADLALANLAASARVFGGERLSMVATDCRAKAVGQAAFLDTDFKLLTLAAAELVDLLDMALAAGSARAA